MANDPTPNDQVANRPGQTAPVPLPSALQPSTDQTPAEFSGWDKLFAKQGQEPAGWKNLVSETGHVPMLTPDGKQSGDVPLPRAKEARTAGFHLAVPMVAPNRTAGWVPYHRVSEAIASGFQHVNDTMAAAADELSSLTSVGLLPAFLKTPRGQEISQQFNQEIHDIIHNPEKRLNTLVGMVGAGGGEIGEGGEGLEEALGAKPGAPKKIAETSQAPIPEETKVPEPKAPEKPVPAETKVPRTLEAKATEPSKYEVPAKAEPEPEEKGQVVPKPTYHGEPVRVPTERTTGEFDAAIKEGKAVPAGIQKGDPEIDLPNLVLFHDPATGSTLALPDSQVTAPNVRAQLRTSRAAYLKAKPQESETVQPGHPLHIPEEPATETSPEKAEATEKGSEDLVMQQRKERQPALPSPYKVRVEYTDEDGTPKQTFEDIQAYTARDAIERAQKKFPDASEWGIQSVGDRPVSSTYTVPTGKMLSFPNSLGLEGDERVARDARTMYHELGHAMVGQKEGIVNKGIVRHTYPGLTGARAAILWDSSASDIYEPGKMSVAFGSRGNLVGARVIKPDRLPGMIRTHMAGIAADELRGIPRNQNNNFSIRERDSDGRLAYQDLRNAGISDERAREIMNQAVDDAKEYLTHPAVKSVIDENALVREPDLSKQFHMSPERLRSMHEEVQRRMANEQKRQGKLGFADNGGDNGGRGQGITASIPGAQSQSPSGIGQSVSPEGEVKPAENVPGLLDTLRGASKPLENPNPVKPTSEPTPGSGSAIKPADTPAEAVPPTNTLTHPKAKEYAASVLRISAKIGKDAAINSGRRIVANGSTAPGEHPELQQLTDWLNQWESTVTSKELEDRMTMMKDNPLKVIGSGESNALPAPQPPVNKNLLQVSADAKTIKGEKLGYMTGIMYLAPDTTSGIANTCPFATEGCRKACLFTAGRAGIFPKINQARIAKTASFKFSRPEFMDQLGKNIKALVRKAGREGYKPAVRLNGTSDLPWENVKTSEGKNIFEQFPDVQFYDYTKNPGRMDQYVKGEMPSNYHLTFSRSESNDPATIEILKNGGNAAVVFDTKKGYALPKEWNGFKVIDGDESDVRFIDGKSQVIGLRAKGKARKDTSGFVLNVEPGEKLAPKSK
jgi:hypothetical protein